MRPSATLRRPQPALQPSCPRVQATPRTTSPPSAPRHALVSSGCFIAVAQIPMPAIAPREELAHLRHSGCVERAKGHGNPVSSSLLVLHLRRHLRFRACRAHSSPTARARPPPGRRQSSGAQRRWRSHARPRLRLQESRPAIATAAVHWRVKIERMACLVRHSHSSPTRRCAHRETMQVREHRCRQPEQCVYPRAAAPGAAFQCGPAARPSPRRPL